MAKGERKVKEGFWIGLAFIIIIAYALLMDWWKENAVIGWSIVAVIVVGFVFCLFRFPTFRIKIFGTAKKTSEKVIFNDDNNAHNTSEPRIPIPQKLRNDILHRANYRCENPDCKKQTKLEFHHIDMNKNLNTPSNLIALCPTCHTEFHDGKYEIGQLRNWVSYNWQRYKKQTSQQTARHTSYKKN